MSLLDGMTAQLFQSDGDGGASVFYPNGVAGQGYILPDEATEQRLKRFTKAATLIGIIVPILGTQVLTFMFGAPGKWPVAGWLGLFLLVIGYGAIYQLAIRRRLAGLQTTSRRLSLTKSVLAHTRALPKWYLVMMAIAGPLLLLGSVISLGSADSMTDRILAIVGGVLFSLSTWQAFVGLSSSRKTASNNDV